MRLTEFVALDWRNSKNHIKHLDITAWDVAYPGDVASIRLASYNGLEYVETLDISRLGLTSNDVKLLFCSPFIENLRWLSLAGNVNVGEEAIQWICWNIEKGVLNLDWLDLRGTACDATPYLDGEFGEVAVWRMPLIARNLAKDFGYQKWMTLGRPSELENEEYIPTSSFPVPRFQR